jgi:hypothetical protein
MSYPDARLGPARHLRVAQQRLGQDQAFHGRSGEGGIVAAMASLDANPCRFH